MTVVSRHRYQKPAHLKSLRLRNRLTGAVVGGVVAAMAISAGSAGAAPTHPTKTTTSTSAKIYFGVVGERTSGVSAALGRHSYAQLYGRVPTGRMITMGTSNLSWNAVATAGPGSAAYNALVRWADTLKARGETVLLAPAHEPEASGQAHLGNASGYISFFRRVVDVFRARGASNVEYVWQMTSYSFSVSSGDSRAAAKWYPGDNYVGDVGADGYNWYDCRSPDRKWVGVSAIADKPLAFARAHGKKLVLPEFGSQSGSLRTAWLNDVHRYLIQNSSSIRGAYYFDHDDTSSGRTCHWALRSSSDTSALNAIINDSQAFAG
jgi:hypothetical protein